MWFWIRMMLNMVGMMLMMDSGWVVVCYVVGESAQYLPTVCTHTWVCITFEDEEPHK